MVVNRRLRNRRQKSKAERIKRKRFLLVSTDAVVYAGLSGRC